MCEHCGMPSGAPSYQVDRRRVVRLGLCALIGAGLATLSGRLPKASTSDDEFLASGDHVSDDMRHRVFTATPQSPQTFGGNANPTRPAVTPTAVRPATSATPTPTLTQQTAAGTTGQTASADAATSSSLHAIQKTTASDAPVVTVRDTHRASLRTRSEPPPTNIAVAADTVRPPIVSRADWGAAPPPRPYLEHIPQQLTLHHEGVLIDGSMDAASYLRRIQIWSLNDRKWPDIPYHFVLDLTGRIFEGRPVNTRGDTNTSYQLEGHVLVAVLGKYDAGEQQPNKQQIESIIALMAWLADQYHLEPDLIYGHRDFIKPNASGEHIDPRTGEKITCPGDNLYAYLPTVRTGVGRLLAASHNHE